MAIGSCVVEAHAFGQRAQCGVRTGRASAFPNATKCRTPIAGLFERFDERIANLLDAFRRWRRAVVHVLHVKPVEHQVVGECVNFGGKNRMPSATEYARQSMKNS